EWSSRRHQPEALTPIFHSRMVCILPDNDAAGNNHGIKVATALCGIAASIRIIQLPNLPPGGDVSDWLDHGGDAAALLALSVSMPAWQPHAADISVDVARDALVPYCDEALTLAFSERHADDLRYCEVFGRWFEWRAGRWLGDTKRRVFTLARRLCRDHSATALRGIDDEKAAARIGAGIASAKTVAAVVNLARADVRHATGPEDWDADAWALNTHPASAQVDDAGRRARTTERRCARRSPRSRPLTRTARAGDAFWTRSPAATPSCRHSWRGSPATA
ncbi:MAG: hypothetical protein U1E35_07345, partial [Rhodospirillales bacterium]